MMHRYTEPPESVPPLTSMPLVVRETRTGAEEGDADGEEA